MEMKFEQIKDKAKREFLSQFSRAVEYPVGGHEENPALKALLPFVRELAVDRADLREFAEKFEAASSYDPVANRAKEGEPWSQMLLMAREEGLRFIDRWDVRRVTKLVDLFPGIVPKKYGNSHCQAYMADDEDSTWVVSFDEPKSKPALRMG